MAEAEKYVETPPLEGDIALLRQYARSREPAAFVELSRRHAGVVYGTCLRITANVHDAEELTQDCFSELARRATTIRSSVGGWLHSMATNRALNAVRSRKRRREHEEQAAVVEEQGVSENEMAWRDLEPLLDQAIESLPEELRTPLILHFLESRSQSAVAVQLGVHQSTVSRRIQEAIEVLRVRLRESGFVMAIAPLSSLLAAHAGQAADPHLLASLEKIALAGISSTATGNAIGGVGTLFAKLSTWGKALTAIVSPLIVQLVLGGWWGFAWAMAVLSYIAWRRPKWHEELSLAMGGKGYGYEFFPLARWTWTTPPPGWRKAILQAIMGSVMMWCVAIALLIPQPWNAMGLGWAAMMMVYGAVPLMTALRIWLRVRTCPADARKQPEPLPPPPDTIGVVQSIGMAVAMTLCAVSFALWHIRRGQPREWLALLLVFLIALVWAYVDVVEKVWSFRRGRQPRGTTDTDSRVTQSSNRPSAALGALILILLCVLVWTNGAIRQCADYFWKGKALDAQAVGWALCAPLSLIFLMATIGLLSRLRGRMPRLVWVGLASASGLFGTVNLALVSAWLFLGPSTLPPPPSQRAARIVGNIGNVLQNRAAAIPQLKKDIHSPDVDVRRRAAILLGLMDVASDEVIPELQKALSDKDKEVRSQAAFTLAHLGSKAKSAIPELQKAMSDPDKEVRFAAIMALRAMGPDAKRAIPNLIHVLGDSDSAVREEAAAMLANFGREASEAVPELRKTLSDKNERVRSAAAWALEEIGPPAKAAIPELERMMTDKYWLARSHAASALGNIGPAATDAIPELRKTMLADENAQVRWSAAGALQNLGPAAKEATADVEKALADPNPTVRSVAAYTLGKIASPTESVIADLRKALHDPDKGVRDSAAWALKQLGAAASEQPSKEKTEHRGK